MPLNDCRNPTAAEIKAEVESHLLKQDEVEAILPAYITIGPFYINTEGVRSGLSKKCRALANAVLDLLAKKLRMQAEDACDEFKAIQRRLYEKPNTIEELAELREWTKTIPEKIAEHQVRIVNICIYLTLVLI